jgi:hypothetical protein
MYTRYSLSKLVRLRRYFNLRRMFKCLDTLLLILSTWFFHLASLLNVTPKCLTQILYRETGWELLSARRKRRKLQLFYNIVNKNTPNYLCTLIPPTIQRTSVHPLRNGNDIILPFCRLSSTSDSFIPSIRVIFINYIIKKLKFPSLPSRR